MSRVGKHPVIVDKSIQCEIVDNVVRLKKGNVEREYSVPQCLSVVFDNGQIIVKPLNNTREAECLWGTTQRNLSNIANGLHVDFSIELKMVGVGYKAAVSGSKLTMQLGFSHDVVYEIPDGITIKCPDQTTMIISGSDKKQVGDVVAYLRKFRPPEPYKGKGILKAGENIYRKEGKKK